MGLFYSRGLGVWDLPFSKVLTSALFIGRYSWPERLQVAMVSFRFPEWEKTVDFNPSVDQTSQKESWVTLGKGSPQLLAHHARAEPVVRGEDIYDINTLPLRNPDTFVSGGLHNHVNECRKVLSSDETAKMISYIRDRIDVTPFLGLSKAILKANNTTVTTPP